MSKWLDQLASLKASGEKLVLRAWIPINGEASTQAEKRFREFPVEWDLLDATPFAKLTGKHAFRHTLLTRASNTVPRIAAGPLAGHVSDTNTTQRGYAAELTSPPAVLWHGGATETRCSVAGKHGFGRVHSRRSTPATLVAWPDTGLAWCAANGSRIKPSVLDEAPLRTRT